jgi:hypothetical protein
MRRVYLKYVMFFACLFGSFGGYSQILSGTLSVSGIGCGCAQGCDLSAIGGPDCGAGVLGNCLEGHLPMSISIPIPEGCQVTVTASMGPRPNGCTTSGADGNAITNDRLKVQGTSAKNWIVGNNNALISDSYSQTGGTITVSGYANRADEIITYAVYEDIPGCFLAALPVTWGDISLTMEEGRCLLSWFTWSEYNNSFFAVEASSDGVNFREIKRVEGSGTSQEKNVYETSFPASNVEGENIYVRLRQVDYNGQYSLSPVYYIPLLKQEYTLLNFVPLERYLELFIPSERAGRYTLSLYAAGGLLLQRTEINSDGHHQVQLPENLRGFFIAVLEESSRGILLSRKIPAM